MKTETESDRDKMNEMILDLLALIALIGPALSWIYQTGNIDCGHNCMDLHSIGENYRFLWPLAVAITLGMRAIYAYRRPSGTSLTPPIALLILFALLTVFGWILAIRVVGATYPAGNFLIVPIIPIVLCYGLDRSLMRFHGKSLNLPTHWWERMSVHMSLLTPLAVIATIFFTNPELYYFHF